MELQDYEKKGDTMRDTIERILGKFLRRVLRWDLATLLALGKKKSMINKAHLEGEKRQTGERGEPDDKEDVVVVVELRVSWVGGMLNAPEN